MAKFSFEHLRRFTPFTDLSDEYLQKLFEKLELKQLEKGKILFRRGVEQKLFHYLLKGQVELVDSQYNVEPISVGDDRALHPLSEEHITSVSAVAKAPVVYFEIERDFVDLVLAWSQSSDEDENAEQEEGEDWMSVLLEAPLFHQIPPGNIQQLFVKFEERDVKKDDTVIREGEPGDYFYVIARGKAVVKLPHGDDVILSAGQYFGEEALIADTPRNATIVMGSSGQLMRLGKDDFKTLLQEPVINYLNSDELGSLKLRGSVEIIDVRMSIERRMGSVPASRSMALASLRKKMLELDEGAVCVVTDDGGRRSEVAAHLLSQSGFEVSILKDAQSLYA